MSTTNVKIKPILCRFIEAESKVLLELTNATDGELKQIEILTVFLKEESTLGGPSQAHIRFEPIKSLQPGDKAILSHRTWINGRPAALDDDQLERLKSRAGEVQPYVLDISWEDREGKSCFQRIPVGH